MNVEDPYPINRTLRAISVKPRREVLSTLRHGDSPLSVKDLAKLLTTTERGPMSASGETPEIRSPQSALVHVHLPALDYAGLVEWDRDEGTVGIGSHPALDDPRFHRLLGVETDKLDTVLSGLSHEHRRIVLTELNKVQTTVTAESLAQKIRRHETEMTGRLQTPLDEIFISLHHRHLPKLSDMGLIWYSSTTDHVAYREHATLDYVLRIIHEPNEHVADKLDGFLGGLHDSYREASQDVSEGLEWPHFWRVPHHG